MKRKSAQEGEKPETRQKRLETRYAPLQVMSMILHVDDNILMIKMAENKTQKKTLLYRSCQTSRMWARPSRQMSLVRLTLSPSWTRLTLHQSMSLFCVTWCFNPCLLLFLCRERLCCGLSIFEVFLQRIKVS